jgi:hypothetical protein
MDEPVRLQRLFGTKRNQLTMTIRDHLDTTVPADVRDPSDVERFSCLAWT